MANTTPPRSSHNTDAEYNLPNDSLEHARLEEQAAGLAELMHNRVIHAPLHEPHRLLDVGCGTGAVTYHLGATYPTAAAIYGLDLSPVPRVDRPGPPAKNIAYIQGDVRRLALEDERLRPASFDYVFGRLLICGMTDWPGYFRDTVTPLLRPGGWVEVQELDYVWYRHGRVCSDEWKWVEMIQRGAREKGLDLNCGRNAAGYMRQAGLVDVSVVRYAAPFGTWAERERPESRRIGAMQARDLPGLYAFLVPRLVEGLGLGEGEVAELVRESQGCLGAEEGKDWGFYVTVGRNPG